MSVFTIGCDPEIFVLDPDGRKVSAHDIGVPGTKEEPHKVKDGAVQVDGLALEINVNPVEVDTTKGPIHFSQQFEEFNRRIVSVLGELKRMLPKGYYFDISPSRRFDKDYFDSLPDQSKILGCDPDFNAWKDGEMNPRPEGDDGLRGAAGHFHIGWADNLPVNHPEHMEICSYLVRNLDRTVGCAMLVIDPDSERRKVYGQAGAFRPKKYGVEYRTPSNAWLQTKNYRKFIWYTLIYALRYLSQGREYNEYPGVPTRKVINENMRDIAHAQVRMQFGSSFAIPNIVPQKEA